MLNILKKIIYNFVLINKTNVFGEKPRDIIFVEPTYYIINKLDEKSTVIDVGTGDNADLSQALIKKYNLVSYGFDPTLKHQPSLKKIERGSNGHFIFHNFALSSKSGEAEFFESVENISGSFSTDHINIKKNNKKYSVKTITLKDIILMLPIKRIDLIKIDIEGEEYNLIKSLEKELADKIQQFVVEFHHHCIDKYSVIDNIKAIRKMESFGFKFYSKDGINYLFYKDNDKKNN